MRSSDSLQYSLWLDFLPSSWASSPLCPTRPLRHHPEKSRRLPSPCAVRYMHPQGMTEKSLACISYLETLSVIPYEYIEMHSGNFSLYIFQSAPVLDVSAILKSCVHRKRTVLTVPWLVEFLSMLDYTGPLLPCYRTALGLLLQIYRFVTCNRLCFVFVNLCVKL